MGEFLNESQQSLSHHREEIGKTLSAESTSTEAMRTAPRLPHHDRPLAGRRVPLRDGRAALAKATRLAALCARRTGAAHQRAVLGRTGDLRAVVIDAIAE